MNEQDIKFDPFSCLDILRIDHSVLCVCIHVLQPVLRNMPHMLRLENPLNFLTECYFLYL